MREKKVNRYKMYKSGKHLVFSLFFVFFAGLSLGSSNILSSNLNNGLNFAISANADNISSNVDWNNWQNASKFSAPYNVSASDDGHFEVSNIGGKLDKQGDTQAMVTLNALTVRYSLDAANSRKNSVPWSQLNASSLNNIVVTDSNNNTLSIPSSNCYFVSLDGTITTTPSDSSVWLYIPFTNTDGLKIIYSNSSAANVSFNQKFKISFDLNAPGAATRTGYKFFYNIDSTTIEPKIIKSYYRDINNNDLQPSSQLGLGGAMGQTVTSQAQDLTSMGYHFIKSYEYTNDDNHVISSQNSSITHRLSSDEVADVFVYAPNNTGSNNTGSNNTGDNNTGNSNVGSNNSGDNNAGNSNVGSNNSGDNNTGNSNAGSNNSGDNNTGNSNAGSNNHGDNNTGNSNVGSNNSGDNNTGNSNAGSNNHGDNNTG
ncbi:KxYKxGKxW signal peptide domain-containing protein, partial [Fructobacillus tropaeoli]|uniref:KxYKxGKxW signal peptide domain-containing protein n=1 Tax=Fructobacillus tropaeoli TaxID=709323 RepID=UPI0030C88CE7